MPAKRTIKKRQDAQLDRPAAKQPKEQPGPDTEASPNLGLEFMTMGRPVWDFHREYDPQELQKMPDKEFEKLNKDFKDEGEKHHEKDTKDFPGWPWVVSKEGFKMYESMYIAIEKRDPEAFGMFFYNDTFGYGVGEVLNTHLNSFAEEHKKSKPSAALLWAHMEAFAWLFMEEEHAIAGAWNHIDDANGVRNTVSMISLALLATLNQLELDDLWDSVPNLALTLSMFFAWFPSFEDAMDREDKAYPHPAMIQLFAKRHDLTIEGVYNVSKCLDEYSIDDLGKREENLVNKVATKDKFKFNTEWKKFAAREIAPAFFATKGSCYDITKMTKQKRIEASYENFDPLEGVKFEDSGIY